MGADGRVDLACGEGRAAAAGGERAAPDRRGVAARALNRMDDVLRGDVRYRARAGERHLALLPRYVLSSLLYLASLCYI